jgi:hypothetical protein
MVRRNPPADELFDASDSALLIADVQEGFPAKIDEDRGAGVVGRALPDLTPLRKEVFALGDDPDVWPVVRELGRRTLALCGRGGRLRRPVSLFPRGPWLRGGRRRRCEVAIAASLAFSAGHVSTRSSAR